MPLARLLVALAALSSLACHTQAPPQCPACECECAYPQGEQGERVAKALLSPPPENPTGLAELTRKASRQMAHEDGAGCLTTLGQIREQSPSTEASLTQIRAQCEMLTGHCEAGKARLTATYQRDMAFSAKRAGDMAETIASMYCRGGDTSERDRLLVALGQLQKGAYIDDIGTQACNRAIAEVVELAPKVKPRDVDDTRVANVEHYFGLIAAECLARAGDCSAAERTYRDHLAPAYASMKVSRQEREKIIAESFRSSVRRCANP